jgi:Holliday junction resolvase RusA-like endonuclease
MNTFFLILKSIWILSYWERQTQYTPESRIETHESMKKKRERESNEFVVKKKRNHFIYFWFILKEQNLNQNLSVNISVMMVVHLIVMSRSKSFLSLLMIKYNIIDCLESILECLKAMMIDVLFLISLFFVIWIHH